MTLIKNLQSSITKYPIRSALYLSWLLFGLIFISYSTTAWFSTTKSFFTQLESMNYLVSKNTQQQATSLFYQIDRLEQGLLAAESEQLNIEDFFYNQQHESFDHSFLITADNTLLFSSFQTINSSAQDPSLDLSLNNIVFSDYLHEKLNASKTPAFATTFSLGKANTSQYLPICRSTAFSGASLLCIALSTSNRQLNWNSVNNIHDTAIRVIDSEDNLLYANPLPMHKRDLLGKPIAIEVAGRNFNIERLINTGAARFYNHQGLDDINRLGSIQHLKNLDLFVVVSVPMTHAIIAWLKLIVGPTIMLLAFLIATFSGFRFSKLRFDNAQATYRMTENALLEQERTLKLLVSNIPGIVYRIRIPDYQVLFITDGCQELLGHSAHSYLSGDKNPFDSIHEDDQDILIKHADSINSSKKQYENVFRITAPNGELKWIMDRGRAINADSNSVDSKNLKEKKTIFLEGIFLDITEHMLSQQQVEYLATRDPLTELANRYSFNDELINRIGQFREEKQIALLFIDLDRFKTINDSLGHQVGDRLLKLVAERLQQCISEDDLLARLSGDEFMVMMVNPINIDDIKNLAVTINKSLSQTFAIDYYKLNTSCSIGISIYPQDSIESHTLMRNADTAMFSAKASGGNHYQFYTEELNQRANNRLTIETELRRAIKENEFVVHYQPQVNADTGSLEGAEALVRWMHPTAGLVSPIEFIPVAEETGLIRDIGDWVLEESCRTFKQWNGEADLNLSVAVNVSVRQIDDSFIVTIADILQKTGMKADQLELEITESLLMENVEDNIRILESINQLGVRFAMDDFGTGYSSLSYLRQFPISKLKVDRSFVNDITDEPDDEAIIRAIIAMGKTLKLKIIAEGVENHQQLILLQAMGCNSYQGYFFSKPLTAEDFYNKYIKPSSLQLQERGLD